ncbi:hypothetical protein BGZ99_007115 [Dissophora globulifera]|uniref:Uncharacterized protein n=1 Tax=Dissophora globulifera TaxID=979702 RepID=A0A9P6RSR2_9FUNG|nr:hypothetical protein BGZ99_007115 [Dissophora globulifera]
MPRKTPNPNKSTSATAIATLNDPSHPYPTPSTSPLLVPTLPPPPSPLSVLSASISFKTPNQHHVHDSTLSLPLGTTLNITRKNGSSHIGQSILGQLLAAGRDHHKQANDATLSHETIRPKEQRRRSILPTGWTMSFSKPSTVQSLPLASSTLSASAQQTGKVTPGSTLAAGRNVMENDEQVDQQPPELPSAWLEGLLSQLARHDLQNAPHYATLPRVTIQEPSQNQLRPLFADVNTRSKDKKSEKKSDKHSNSSGLKSASSTSTLDVNSRTLSPRSKPQTLSRRSSACELALGEEAHDVFHQNRPKTLSSVAILSSIAPVKKSLRNVRQHSLDPSTVPTDTVTEAAQPFTDPATSPDALTVTSPAAPTTTKTTRGRFTIESSSPPARPIRTRTLSCTEVTTLSTLSTLSQQKPALTPADRPAPSPSPASSVVSALSFSLPPSSSLSSNRLASSRSSHASIPPIPISSQPPSHTTSVASEGGPNSNDNSSSPPISIPRGGKTNHQRTHSSSSIQSYTSTCSRRSQVIIPPPVSVSTLQFASFSSIASPGGSGKANGGSDSSQPSLPQQPPLQRRPTPNNSGSGTGTGNGNGRVSSSSNNFRNLSIQIVDGDRRDNGQDSRDSQVFRFDTPTLHPLDDDPAMRESKSEFSIRTGTHQTMNRVHPTQDSIDSAGESSTPLTACSTSYCSESSISGSLGQGTGPQGIDLHGGHPSGYYRQRSLSAINFTAQRWPNQGSNPLPHSQQQQQQQLPQTDDAGPWGERTTRRTHGSVSNADIPYRGHTPPINSTPLSSSYSSGSYISHGEVSDVVMVKKSATGRMFTVERTIPSSPTKFSRFTVVSAADDQ